MSAYHTQKRPKATTGNQITTRTLSQLTLAEIRKLPLGLASNNRPRCSKATCCNESNGKQFAALEASVAVLEARVDTYEARLALRGWRTNGVTAVVHSLHSVHGYQDFPDLQMHRSPYHLVRVRC